jgi:hypothetical protein
MSIPAADLRKIVKIVRQYEVIYGGGISSSDAAVREECENIVGIVEAELGGKRSSSRGSSRAAKALPSLVDAKKRPRGSEAPRPTTARSSEIARLGMPRGESGKKPGASAKAGAGQAKGGKAFAKPGRAAPAAVGKAERPGASKAGAAAKGRAAPAKAQAALKAKGKSGGADKARAGKAKAVSARDKAAAVKASRGSVVVAARRNEVEDEVLKDVRSRHVSAVRAAAERADRIAGAADESGEVETKRHFAALHLFDAFKQNKLPRYGGFIICIRFDEDSGYAVVEIIGYENLQDIYPDGDTLVFKSVGCKLYAIVEPAGYLLKSVEPVNRPALQMVPYRFAELLLITTKRFQNVFIGRKPVFMPTSFSVYKPAGEDIAVLFYDIADVYVNIQDFLIMILRERLGVPIPDSRKAAEIIVRGIHEFKLWLDEA